jgi:phage terminase small subunit
MNDNLKAQHREQIDDPRAWAMYETLCAACETREGGMTDADQMIVGDYAMAEQIKQQLILDIRERGIGSQQHNGRQSYWQDNKSVPQLRAYCDQQRKLLAELRLTPQARRAEPQSFAADDFDDFPDA